MLVFVLQWPSPLVNSDDDVVSVSIDFPLNSGLHDHLRDVPREDIFKLSASSATSKFCEWVQVGTDVYIPHHKYQFKPHPSTWFSAACAAAIVHRNHFFCLY